MSVTIYHNPRCSKSRQTLALLQEQGIEPVVIEYLQQPPGQGELIRILEMLGIPPRKLMRTNEAVYKEKNLDNPALTAEQLVAAMVENPILIERPLVLANGRAALGRPPENVLEIL